MTTRLPTYYIVDQATGGEIAEAEGYENAIYAAQTIAAEDELHQVDVRDTQDRLAAFVLDGRLVEWRTKGACAR